MWTQVATAVFLFQTIHAVFAGTVHIYVSPEGSDSNSGLDPSLPLKTLYAARDKLEEPGIKNNVVYIELMKGYHDLATTVSFTKTYAEPVTVRAYQNQEVHVTGGKRVPSNLFKVVTDPVILKRIPPVAHEKVRQVHLPDAGITNYGILVVSGFYTSRVAPLEITINGKFLRLAEWPNRVRQVYLPDAGITNYGTLNVFGFYIARTAALELSINGAALRLAEWPNREFINIVGAPNGRYGTKFTYDNNRDARWVGEKEPWIYGYTYWSWADHSAKVTNIDPKTHTITCRNTTHYGFRKGHLTPDRRDGHQPGYSQQGGYFRVFNMLSELDLPGEYFLDRSTGILYVWPNTPTGSLNDQDVVYASLIDDCIDLGNGVSNYFFEGFTLEACRHYGIASGNGFNLTFSNLEIKNTGSFGIDCSYNCRNMTVQRCDIHDCDGGINLSGGDRKTLTPNGNVVQDNHIWRFGRVTAVGANGVGHEGVGTHIQYNHVHDGTYFCIFWKGNDHLMEYNFLENCCYNTSDCGAFYTGRDWSMRGIVIRYNYIIKTYQYWPGPENRGVMLDDQYSSVTAEKNVFAWNHVHMNIGGGRDTYIQNNTMFNASWDSVNVDARGFWGSSNDKTLNDGLKAVPYTDALWSSRYPKLAAMANLTMKQRDEPSGNHILTDIFYLKDHERMIGYHRPQDARPDWFYHLDTYIAKLSDFADPENLNFTLLNGAKEWAQKYNFPEAIPFNRVGPRFPVGPYHLNKGRRYQLRP